MYVFGGKKNNLFDKNNFFYTFNIDTYVWKEVSALFEQDDRDSLDSMSREHLLFVQPSDGLCSRF